MSLNELRHEINELDAKILELFAQRLSVCHNVALYKQENNLPVFQPEREDEVIKKIREKSPPGLENCTEVLFKNIMDISKARQSYNFV